jgi:hypothetical protein
MAKNAPDLLCLVAVVYTPSLATLRVIAPADGTETPLSRQHAVSLLHGDAIPML